MEKAEVLDEYSEHGLRNLIEGGASNIISNYYKDKNCWEVFIDQGDYIFKGRVSSEGVPTEGVISHKNEDVFFKNNQKLSPKGFAHTIMRIYEKIQEYYEEEEEEEEMYYNRFEVNKKAKRERTTAEYQNAFGGIQEQEHESDSDEEGNVIHEEPTPPTQQPQNQSNLNLWNSQSQQSGLGGNK